MMLRVLLLASCVCVSALAAESQDPITTLSAIGPQGKGHAQAISAWRQLAQSDADALPRILSAIDDSRPLAANWLRSAAEQIAQQQRSAGKPLPSAQLEQFILDRQHAARARRLAYELLLDVDASVKQRLIPQMLDDPSLELRRDAVAMVLAEATESSKADKPGAIATYQKALFAARDLDQIEASVQGLDELGHKVDLPRHFGFITHWQLIGPFDNTDKGGFDVAYPPEQKVDLQAEHPGKSQPVSWVAHHTDDKYGMVNLNAALGKNMGAAGYAYCQFKVPAARKADVRLGCINANKVWLNGKQIMSHHVYHAGTKIDQYVAPVQLRAGTNHLLLKICQNEQTENWAQDWQFQVRISDHVGTAILAENRDTAL